MDIGKGPTPTIRSYWEAMRNKGGNPLGPIHMVLNALRKADIEAPHPHIWHLPGRPSCDIRTCHDFKQIAAQIARDTVWKDLASKRANYSDLKHGMDHSLTTHYIGKIKDDHSKNMMHSIQADGVWTTAKAHKVNAGPMRVYTAEQRKRTSTTSGGNALKLTGTPNNKKTA